MNPFPRQVLCQLVSDYEVTLLGDHARVGALLADLCGGFPRERFLLVHALRERIPDELRNQPQGGLAHKLRLSQRLQKRFGFSPESALWAVESWSLALNADSQEDFSLVGKPFAQVEEVMLQILAQEPLSSHEVATVLKTTKQQAVHWLKRLQDLGKVESIWLKQRSPHYAFYKVVSSDERIAAEVAARKRAEEQFAAEAVAREKAEKRAEAAKETERQKLRDRIDAETAARLKAERRADSAEREAFRKANRRIDREVSARKKAEKRAEREAKAREKAERRAMQIEELAGESKSIQRQTHRQTQPIKSNSSQQKQNSHPIPSTTVPSTDEGQSSPRQSGHRWLWWLLLLIGLPGLCILSASLG